MSLADKIIFGSESESINAIDNDADVNEYDKYGFRPLIQAIICKKPKVLKYLIKSGANIEQMDILGKSPLQWAADRSETEYCRFLLQNGFKNLSFVESNHKYYVGKQQLETSTSGVIKNFYKSFI